MSRPRMIFLSGIPAAGKSFFARHLQAEHGFVHLEHNNRDNWIHQGRLGSRWQRLIETGTQAEKVVRSLSKFDGPVVLEYGFAPDDRRAHDGLRALRKRGFELWWFDADLRAARRAFVRRGGLPVRKFDRHLRAIGRYRSELDALFLGNVVTTLEASGERAEPSRILESMNAPAGRRPPLNPAAGPGRTPSGSNAARPAPPIAGSVRCRSR